MPATITHTRPVTSQRLPPPKGPPTCLLVHSMSRPSDHLHLHPSVNYLQMPCCLPATTYTKSAADVPSCACQIAPQRSSPPASQHCIPAIICAHQPAPYFPLRTPTTVLQWAPNDYLQRISDIRRLHPSNIAIQQPFIPASHTLSRRSSAPWHPQSQIASL